MLSALSLLLETNLNPDQLDLAGVIEESGNVLLQVVNDILDFSKLANGGFSITPDVVNVREIVGSVLRNFQMNSSPGTVLESEFDEKLPLAVKGDNLRFRQIVQNMVSNATKFTENGSIRVRATVQEELLNEYILLTEVIDT